jgi:N-methylhydantoinase A
VFEIAIDTGGTFTDGVLIDDENKVSVGKCFTDMAHPEKSLAGCISILAGERNLTPQQLIAETGTIVVGTTIATNSIVSRTGARCCMVTTKGFRDMLELSSRIPKDDPYDLRVPPPQYLVPRYLRFEVEERIQFDGRVIVPLNAEDVHRAVEKAKEHHVDVPIVCFLHSYMNPQHEEQAAEIIRAEFPNVVISSHILRKRMEGYRFHTAVLAGYVFTQIANFVGELEHYLKSENFNGTLLFSTNAGGVATPEICLRNPALLIGSGPAAGPLFARLLGELSAIRDVASVDVGGTTADLCILPGGKITTTTEMIVAGHRNAVESVDVTSVGVGGGAIARIDDRGILCVGPESAGADPGPACYGKGGQKPSLTDADVVLGYIPPDYFLGGAVPLHADLARKAIQENIADLLRINVVEAAYAILSIAEENIAKRILLNFIKTGYDPREFTLVVGGGAGPVHAAGLAERLEMNRLYIPRHAGVFCPFGILLADFKYILSRFYYQSGEGIRADQLKDLFLSLEKEGLYVLKRQGLAEKEVKVVRGAAMRYVGQLHSIDIFLPEGAPGDRFGQEERSTLVRLFHERHASIYGRSDPSMPVSMEEVKVHAIGMRRGFRMTEEPRQAEDPSGALKRKRAVYFRDGRGFEQTPCYAGELLKHGNVVAGPAIIEEAKTTLLVPANYRLTVDAYGNFLMRRC